LNGIADMVGTAPNQQARTRVRDCHRAGAALHSLFRCAFCPAVLTGNCHGIFGADFQVNPFAVFEYERLPWQQGGCGCVAKLKRNKATSCDAEQGENRNKGFHGAGSIAPVEGMAL
jgi:hypothetical protein